MEKRSLIGIVLSSLAFGTVFSGCETIPTTTYQHHRSPPRTVVVPVQRHTVPRHPQPVFVTPPRSYHHYQSSPRYTTPRHHPPTFHRPYRGHSRGYQYCPPPRHTIPRHTPRRSPPPRQPGSVRFRMNW